MDPVQVPAYGIDELKKLVEAVAELISAVDKVFADGLLALFGLLKPITNLRSVDLAKLGLEVKNLDQAERDIVEQAFKAKLNLKNVNLEIKLEAGVSLLDESIALSEEVIATVGKCTVLYTKVKALFV